MVTEAEEFYITSQDNLDDKLRPFTHLVGLSNVTIQADMLQNMPHLRILQNVTIEGECKNASLKELHVV
eukprot:c45424_g1_i1 orf=1-204(-)